MRKDAPIYSQVRRFCPDRRQTGSYRADWRINLLPDLLKLALIVLDYRCELDSSLYARALLHFWRIRVGRLFLISVDHAILLSIKREMLGIKLFGRHGKLKTVFVGPETGGVVSPFWIHHTPGKGTSVHQVGQRGGIFAILFLIFLLRPQHRPHVTEGSGFWLRACRVSVKLWLVGSLRRGHR